MPAHVLLEYTVVPDRLDEVQAAAQRFVDDSTAKEDHLRRHQAYRIEGTRTFVHVLVFEDELAVRDHRNADHTRAFTEAVADHLESGPDIRELDPVKTQAS